MNCIETDNLSCDVAGHRLFGGLTLRVERGQRVRIAGPSGCGKTTLLKTFMGFVPAASGTIRIEGVELNDASVWTLRHKLAYLAQEPDLGAGLVLPRFREPFAYRRNADVRFDADRLGQWLDFFYLPDAILHKELKSLSGGEKQRLALILAILLGRTIFLLDEPVSAMDAAGRKRFLQVFQEHPDWTAVFISHDESLAEMADHTIDLAANGDCP
jgi:ABC-type multidrug transport system ATPase subunit